MKTKSFLITAFLVAMFVIFYSCESDDDASPSQNGSTILPQQFSVEIPDALSHTGGYYKSAHKGPQTTNNDTLQGNDIYENLNFFIAVGEEGAKIVEEIIVAISYYGIDKPLFLSYPSDDDQRIKNLTVVENSEFEGETWEFQLTITDVDSESNPDGGKGMQVFWNRNPVKGIAIIKPYNLDRVNDANSGEAMYRIDYDETGTNGYEAEMTVYVAGLPLSSPEIDPYAMNNMRMWAGKNGNYVDISGNSNHPNAKFFTDDTGFNWAFVASGKEAEDIGVAEIGLPPNTLNESAREQLLEYYSIRNVFMRAIQEEFPLATEEMIAPYLKNTEAPGYFNSQGFMVGGTSPGPEFDDIEGRIISLAPFNPQSVNELTISFK